MSQRRPCLLNAREAHRVRQAFASLLPLEGCVDPRLRAVVADVLAHPGSLARAQLAYGLGTRGGVPPADACRLAVAVEYFHSASLLFDDMPSMDDASERRGRPCPHVVHGEAAATLGALALITRAYALLWESIGEAPASRRSAAAALVGECLGLAGILDGQARDVHFRRQGAAPEEVAEVAMAKTVPLVRLAMVLPAIVAGEEAEALDRLERLASAWGLAYQILDDFKDRLLGPEETGKTAGRDAGLGRPSLPALAGSGRAMARLREMLAASRSLVDSLAGVPGAGSADRWEPLRKLQDFLEAEAGDIGRLLGEREAA